ncbi:hypothetical protein D3C79_1121030 [compost metagenome]
MIGRAEIEFHLRHDTGFFTQTATLITAKEYPVGIDDGKGQRNRRLIDISHRQLPLGQP